MQDWKKIFSNSQLATASMVAAWLHENHIEAKVMNRKDSSYVFMGEAEVYVPSILAEEAIKLIDQMQFT
ncbi:MAG: hypothetical protein EBV82_03510, partial [Chitinophagia bacterium]|jgi:Putative prokaryotic signal transducing protein|nr:hypothetical protein [Chitinophagia bacterium]